MIRIGVLASVDRPDHDFARLEFGAVFGREAVDLSVGYVLVSDGVFFEFKKASLLLFRIAGLLGTDSAECRVEFLLGLTLLPDFLLTAFIA